MKIWIICREMVTPMINFNLQISENFFPKKIKLGFLGVDAPFCDEESSVLAVM